MSKRKNKIKNQKDKRSCRTEGLIRNALIRLMYNRRINIRMIELCREAKITSPTFYSHYSDAEDVLRDQESILSSEIEKYIRKTCDAAKAAPRQATLFRVLLEFVSKHQKYFDVMASNQDRTLIYSIFKFLKPLLHSWRMSDFDYEIYSHSIITIIYHWCIVEKCDCDRIEQTTNYMLSVRAVHIG